MRQLLPRVGSVVRPGMLLLRRSWLVSVFAVWTLFVWVTRINNIRTDDALDRAEKVGRIGLALSLALLAVTVIVLVLTQQAFALRVAVTALAGWTTGVWLLMSMSILLDDSRSGAFKAIHVGLAVVSVVMSVLALWSLVRQPAEEPAQPIAPDGSDPTAALSPLR